MTADDAPADGGPIESGRQVSVVIPVYNEGEDVLPVLRRILDGVSLPCEVLVVHDMPEDTTVPVVNAYAEKDPRVRAVLNTYGRGPARAIRYGIEHADSPCAVVTMADGSDDPRQIDQLARLVERGVVIAGASRYMPGGQQVGGPLLKRTLSRTAGVSLYWLARIGLRDATNSFKAYSTAFVAEVGIDSRAGFEIGLELTAKARRLRRPVAEIPTIWLDRQLGSSNFQLAKWIPQYLRWWRFAFGPRLSVEQVRELAARRTSASRRKADGDAADQTPGGDAAAEPAGGQAAAEDQTPGGEAAAEPPAAAAEPAPGDPTHGDTPAQSGTGPETYDLTGAESAANRSRRVRS